MSEKSVDKLMAMFCKDSNLSQKRMKDIINQALDIAEYSSDYKTIATHVCHDELLADKKWGKKLFKIAIEKADIEYGHQNCMILQGK